MRVPERTLAPPPASDLMMQQIVPLTCSRAALDDHEFH